MTPKIEWFQEILEQEPSSRVFFPLAKLLFESGDVTKALETLRHGLEHHPDFLEARLFLIHLLYSIGDMEGCSSESILIANLFNQYPDFWAAWGQSGAQAGGDFGLYMGLISTLVLYPDLTLKEFLSYGLKGLSERKSTELSHYSNTINSLSSLQTTPQPSDIFQSSSDISNIMDIEEVSDSEEPFFDRPEDMAAVSKSNDDSFPVCTRSMAEVLAEQGDIVSAIKIYQELESQATNHEEIVSLQTRKVELSEMLAQARNASSFSNSTMNSYNINHQAEVIAMLEALVTRLEKRAKG